MPIPKHDACEVKLQMTKHEDLIIGSSAIIAAIIAVCLIFLKR